MFERRLLEAGFNSTLVQLKESAKNLAGEVKRVSILP